MFDASRLSVLVVDDQRAMRTLVRESLMVVGCTQIEEAENGRDALHCLQFRPRHLVISDLNMPEMTGLELLAAVRASAQLRHTGFIMLTARGEVELVQQAIRLGVNNYLTKPFTPAMLHKKMQAVFRQAA